MANNSGAAPRITTGTTDHERVVTMSPNSIPRGGTIGLIGSGEVSAAPVAWAVERITAAAARHAATVVPRTAPSADDEFSIEVAAPESARTRGLDLADGPEASAVGPIDAATPGLLVSGSDAVGLSYALSEVAQRIEATASLAEVDARTAVESPSVPVRGIMRSFSSFHEDLGWFRDREFWTEYLDFIAAQRFNRFHLALGMQYNYGADSTGGPDNYLCLAYPFLFPVEGYEGVRAEGVDAAEQHRNLEALKFIARETVRRGMRFQLGLWNHAFDYGPIARHWFPILGLSQQTHAAYSSAALGHLLAEIPEIGGLSFRVHYEGGIHDQGHEVFWDAMFQAVSEAGRPVEVDMHAKGVDQALLDAVDKPGIDAVLSAKYWAEHMGLPYHQTTIRTREEAKPMQRGHEMNGVTEFTRRFTRYGYADFLAEDRTVDLMFRVWPGTQKLLLWGDPEIARGYGRLATFGNARGVDFCEPLYFKGRKGSGKPGRRDPYVRDDLTLGGREWHKHRYTYTLWGRLAYAPDSDPEVWRRDLRRDYGNAAGAAERALAAAGRILPLHTVVHGIGGSNNGNWPEIPTLLPISPWVHSVKHAWDMGEPTSWGRVSPFDPELFSIPDEYVADLIAGSVGPKYTPIEVASWMESLADEAEAALAEFRPLAPDTAQVRRTVIDLEVLIGLGRHYAHRYRAAVDRELAALRQDPVLMRSAVEHAEQSRVEWLGIIDTVDGVYQDNLEFGAEATEYGHWRDRVPAMDDDLRALRRELETLVVSATEAAPAPIPRERRSPVPVGIRHDAPSGYERGEPLTIALDLAGADEVEEVVLHYRHVNQAEKFRTTTATVTDGRAEAVIDGEYTASDYSLMYYVELGLRGGERLLYPGLDATLSNQPYLMVQSSKARAPYRVR